VIYSHSSRLHTNVGLEPRNGISIQRRSIELPSDARILHEKIADIGAMANAWHRNRESLIVSPVRFKWENSNLKIKKTNLILTLVRLFNFTFVSAISDHIKIKNDSRVRQLPARVTDCCNLTNQIEVWYRTVTVHARLGRLATAAT
jgi:hypothetical protein